MLRLWRGPDLRADTCADISADPDSSADPNAVQTPNATTNPAANYPHQHCDSQFYWYDHQQQYRYCDTHPHCHHIDLKVLDRDLSHHNVHRHRGSLHRSHVELEQMARRTVRMG